LVNHKQVTETQINKVKVKIKRIRGVLSAEKRRYGAFDDSRGIRFTPPGLFIKIGDYTGAMTYMKWYKKNFPDDMGFPDFLFEWTLILFMNNKLKEAERKAFEAFCSNTYIFDKFFGKPVVSILKFENFNTDKPEFTEYFSYSAEKPELSSFSGWLQGLINENRFKELSEAFLKVNKRLYSEDDHETRSYLLLHSNQIKYSY
jgi:hypothetical protein